MKLPNYDISRIIEMAWEDRTPFEAIKKTYNLKGKRCCFFIDEEKSKKKGPLFYGEKELGEGRQN